MTYTLNILKNGNNDLDRMVYTIYEEMREIDISSFRGHYE